MHGPRISESPRPEQLEYISAHLITNAALLTRLFAREVTVTLSRTEAGLLSTLSAAPRRITKLAELERVAQPTMTLLVKRLEQQGLVTRERHAGDGRVVIVRLTRSGATALEDFRSQMRAALRAYLDELPDTQIEALAAAADALGDLIDALQPRSSRSSPPDIEAAPGRRPEVFSRQAAQGRAPATPMANSATEAEFTIGVVAEQRFDR